MGHWVEAGDGMSWVEDPVAPVDTQQNLFGPAAGLPALVGPVQPSAAPAGLPALAGPQTPAAPLAPAPVPTSSPAAASKNNFWDFSNPNLWKQSGNYLITDQTINKEDLPSDFFAKADKKTRGGVSYIYNGTTFRQNDDGTYSPSVFHDNPSWLDKAVNTIAPLAFSFVGGPLGAAAFQAAQGKSLEDIAKGAALSYAGSSLAGGISNSLVDTLGSTGANLAGRIASAEIMSGGKADLSKLLTSAALSEATGALTNTGPSSSDMVEGYFAPGGEGYFSPTTNVVENQIQTNDNTPVSVNPQIAESNTYPTNSVGLDQLVQAFSNPQDLSNTPSVQVASADNAAGLAALQAAQTPTTEQATVPTQAEQQPAVDELIKQLETAQTPQTLEQIMKAEPAPAEAQAAQDAADRAKADAAQKARDEEVAAAEAKAAQEAHDAQAAAEAKAAEERQAAIDKAAAEAKTAAEAAAAKKAQEEHDAQVAAEAKAAEERQAAIDKSNAEAQAARDAQVAKDAADTKDGQNVVKTLEDAGLTNTPTKTVEELLASEPTPAVSPVGPTETLDTLPTPFTEGPESLDDFLKTIGITSPYPDTTPTDSNQDIVDTFDYTHGKAADINNYYENDGTSSTDAVTTTDVNVEDPNRYYENDGTSSTDAVITPDVNVEDQNTYYENDGTSSTSTADKDSTILDTPAVSDYVAPTDEETQDYIDRHILETPDVEDYVAPTDEETQDYVDRHILDTPDVEDYVAPTDEETQDYIDKHILDTPDVEDYVAPTDEETQDYVDRHILDTPDVEDYVAPTDEETQDYVDRHILDDPDVEDYVAPTDEETQDYIDRHILDEPPPEVEDGESPTEQDVIDYVDDHPNDGEEDEDGEDEDDEDDDDEDEESKGGGTGKVNIGGGTKTKGGTTVTPKSTTTTKPAVDTAEFKKLLAGLLASQQTQYLPGIGDVAHIKSNESLFGAIPGTESPASSAHEDNYDPVSELLAQGDGEYASGGHVDDLDVEALLQILRS